MASSSPYRRPRATHTLSTLARRRGRWRRPASVVAAFAAAVFACAAPAPTVLPPPELGDLELARRTADPELYLPPVPDGVDRSAPPSGLVLPVRAERLAADAGAVEPGDAPRLILTLAPCRFEPAEREGTAPPDADDCRAHNRDTFFERSHDALVVPPGVYDIVVRNRALDRPLGLWLRNEPEPGNAVISAGGIEPDGERVWRTTLTEGSYLYSCPLSPTPTYRLVVR